jgi:hypothetical protein
MVALAADMLTGSPCRGVSLPTVEQGEMRYLNPAEIARLAELIRPQPDETRTGHP